MTKGSMKSFMLYTIKGTDKNGEFETKRRYNDFKLLVDVLKKRWPACHIPPLPSVKAMVLNYFTNYEKGNLDG
jgi:hypothetical protein